MCCFLVFFIASRHEVLEKLPRLLTFLVNFSGCFLDLVEDVFFRGLEISLQHGPGFF